MSGNSSISEALRSIENFFESEDGETEKDQNIEQWMVQGKTFFPCQKTAKSMPPGRYVVGQSQEGIFFSAYEVSTDELLVLPDSATTSVMEEIIKFWSKKDDYRKYNLLWKRGVFLWGPPGSGKTASVNMITNIIVERGGVCLYCQHPKILEMALKKFRAIESDRPLVVVLEDIDTIIEQYGEPSLLSVLDGEAQVDNVCFIATSNYPERLDARIINRPSRFDIVELIDMPNAESREFYLKKKSGDLLSDEEIQQWVADTDYMSLAHIKELLISNKVLDVPYEDALKRLRSMNEVKVSSADAKKKQTFGYT